MIFINVFKFNLIQLIVIALICFSRILLKLPAANRGNSLAVSVKYLEADCRLSF